MRRKATPSHVTPGLARLFETQIVVERRQTTRCSGIDTAAETGPGGLLGLPLVPAVTGVVDTAQVDEYFETGIVTQFGGDLDQLIRGQFDGHLTDSDIDGLQAVAELFLQSLCQWVGICHGCAP